MTARPGVEALVALLSVGGLLACASDAAPSDMRASNAGSGAPMLPSNDADQPSAGAESPAAPSGNDGQPGDEPSVGMAGSSGGSTSSEPSGGEDIDCGALALPDDFDDVISTFEDATGATNQVEGRGGGFFTYNDGTGTQDPAPGPLPAATMMQRCDSLYALCMSGSGFTEWGAGMGTDLGPTGADEVKIPFDASEYSGIAFWARIASGTTPAVRVSLKDGNTAPEGGVCDESETSGDTACNDDWGKALNLSTTWTPYTIRFDELRQAGWGAAYDAFDQTKVFGVQWQVGPNLEFDVCIDDVMLVR